MSNLREGCTTNKVYSDKTIRRVWRLYLIEKALWYRQNKTAMLYHIARHLRLTYEVVKYLLETYPARYAR